MDTYWKPIDTSKNTIEWYLVTDDGWGEVVATHAKVHKVDGMWHWITQPPRLCFGQAVSHDAARLAVEEALIAQSHTPEPPMIKVRTDGRIIWSPWLRLGNPIEQDRG